MRRSRCLVTASAPPATAPVKNSDLGIKRGDLGEGQELFAPDKGLQAGQLPGGPQGGQGPPGPLSIAYADDGGTTPTGPPATVIKQLALVLPVGARSTSRTRASVST